MKKPKKSSAKASSVKLSPAQKAANTRKAKQIELAKELFDAKSENLGLKKEVEILQSALNSAEKSLLKKEEKASEIFNKRVDLANKIEELKSELKGVDIDIINMKAKLNSELNILS